MHLFFPSLFLYLFVKLSRETKKGGMGVPKNKGKGGTVWIGANHMRRRREKRELGARSLSGFAWKRDTPILRISYPPPMMENFRRKLHPQKRYENRQHFSLHIYLRTDGWESHQRGGPFGAEASLSLPSTGGTFPVLLLLVSSNRQLHKE